MMKRKWAASLFAIKTVGGQFKTGHAVHILTAISYEEAVGKAHIEARKRMSPDKGWGSHSVVVAEIELNKPLTVIPRRPYEDDKPGDTRASVLLESDRDYFENNREVAIALLDRELAKSRYKGEQNEQILQYE